ncbi:MAG: tyrosine-type recombinase/integrase [Solirubrobacterales bacterium]|nr:tyrosine-type recombinase/integrase [Solirubrobacterales bacterium]
MAADRLTVDLFFWNSELRELDLDREALASVGVELPEIPAWPGELQLQPVKDGTPFMLGSDGNYDSSVNAYLTELTAHLTPGTVRAYAFDLLMWLRFLAEHRGVGSPWDATSADIGAFYEARRSGPVELRIAASTWDRQIGSLSRLFEWGRDRGLVDENPCKVGGRVRLAKGHRREVCAVSLESYRDLRDLGFVGRTKFRDRAFGEMLLTSGGRRVEIGSLLEGEVPLPRADKRNGRLVLAAAVCKNGRGRETIVDRIALQQVRDYQRFERRQAVAEAQRLGVASRMPLRAERVIGGKVVFCSGERVSVADLSVGERLGLWVGESDTGAPAALWLTQDGRPMQPDSWNAVFTLASRRAQRAGAAIELVTPHMLRHTFAVQLLKNLIDVQLGRLGAGGLGGVDSRSAVYQRVAFDPLRIVQQKLGHRDQRTTQIYLNHLDEVQDMTDAALDRMRCELDGGAVELGGKAFEHRSWSAVAAELLDEEGAAA